MPIHWWGPVPNGRKAYGWRFSLASGEKWTAGSNFSGFSPQISGSRWRAYVGTFTSTPFGKCTPLIVHSLSHPRSRRNAGAQSRRTSLITWSKYCILLKKSYRGISPRSARACKISLSVKLRTKKVFGNENKAKDHTHTAIYPRWKIKLSQLVYKKNIETV